MAIDLNSISRAGAAATFLHDAGIPLSSTQADEFGLQLLRVIQDSLVRTGLSADQFQVSLARAPEGSASGSVGARQILVTLTQPASPSQCSLPQEAAETGGTAAAQAAGTPIEVLQNALRNAGLDPARFAMTEIHEVVGYPGGSYMNHQMLVDFGGGVRESYDIALMLRNPSVTVTEMRRLLATPPAV